MADNHLKTSNPLAAWNIAKVLTGAIIGAVTVYVSLHSLQREEVQEAIGSRNEIALMKQDIARVELQLQSLVQWKVDWVSESMPMKNRFIAYEAEMPHIKSQLVKLTTELESSRRAWEEFQSDFRRWMTTQEKPRTGG